MKLLEKIETLIVGIKRWLSYYKVLRNVNDFDFSSILEVEKHQIGRVRDSIIKYHSHLNWKQDVEKMNLALKLLDIIEEDGRAELVCERIKLKDGTVATSPIFRWTLDVYVNTRNSSRYFKHSPDYNDSRSGPLAKDSLRVRKAWELYYKLRCNYTRDWWD